MLRRVTRTARMVFPMFDALAPNAFHRRDSESPIEERGFSQDSNLSSPSFYERTCHRFL